VERLLGIRSAAEKIRKQFTNGAPRSRTNDWPICDGSVRRSLTLNCLELALSKSLSSIRVAWVSLESCFPNRQYRLSSCLFELRFLQRA